MVMTRFAYRRAALALALLASSAAPAAETVAVTAPAQAGAVVGEKENSDAFVWRLFTQFAAPATKTSVVFETWASDEDTFSKTPHWPSVDAPRKFHSSVLGAINRPLSGAHLLAAIDVPCAPPGNAAVGGFPTSGTPTPCIAEQTTRNKPQFDYIVGNGLNTQAGLASAYAKGFDVVMPDASISVKGDWVPFATLAQWIPQIGGVGAIPKLYYTTNSGGVDYALVALHVSSRQNPNWVWGTFEHQLNPGRCDSIGCFDSFGAKKPAVLPDKAAINTQYGECAKTDRLIELMRKAGLADVWANYCLKSTQVDYNAPDGTPYALGSSVIERITGNGTVAASSCIGCHVYASFGADGKPTSAATAMLPYNPTGNPIPAVLEGARQFDFMWGVLLAP
jgi:hypothetical protein